MKLNFPAGGSGRKWIMSLIWYSKGYWVNYELNQRFFKISSIKSMQGVVETSIISFGA